MIQEVMTGAMSGYSPGLKEPDSLLEKEEDPDSEDAPECVEELEKLPAFPLPFTEEE